MVKRGLHYFTCNEKNTLVSIHSIQGREAVYVSELYIIEFYQLILSAIVEIIDYCSQFYSSLKTSVPLGWRRNQIKKLHKDQFETKLNL